MDAAPRPRILFESAPDDLYQALARYAPTVGRVDDDASAIHASDWDILVSFHSTPEQPSGVHVLSFGGHYFRRAPGVRRDVELHARAVRRADTCAPGLASLVERTIVGTAPPPPRAAFASRTADFIDAIATIGAEDAPYAGFMKSPSGSLTLALPDHTTDHAAWLFAFIEYLRRQEPEQFPAAPDWQLLKTWATPDMSAALRELDLVAVERTAALEQLSAREVAATDALHKAADAAAIGPQRALTSDGDDLVAGVLALLRDLGFDAEDRDDHHDAKTGAKLEDLLITDADWSCLAEVKGYTKGAKVNEVSKITGRPSVAYAAEHGVPPDAVWHIVNAWRTTDPTTRPEAIPNEVDLAPLTDANGCLIDTRDLYLAWRDMQEDRVTAADVRASMRGTITRWSWPRTG